MTSYHIPEIWENKGRMSGLNADTAGSRFEEILPKGKKPYQLYSLGTPNGIKATIMFEELKGLGVSGVDYDLFRIDISKGEQFGSDFVSINPNAKIPALLDLSGEEPIRVFESAHILLYLADKHYQLIPQAPKERAEVLNWLFWQTGAAPFLGGGFGHFFHYAKEKLEYPIDRFAMEAKRQLDLLDRELSQKPYIAGDHYTIADIAIWSWYGQLVQDKLWNRAGQFLQVNHYKHIQAWSHTIAKRPAVNRGLAADYQAIS
ncbi:glutathione S-transferase [Streptococcus dysgalactiae subsp. equisimilis]|uniref:glutathione-dependent disulfide-bond oxidoreductase n=1 Tax=Streptococcus dysgalactiae TaxID=1334 RepID=UPI0006183411|nr:glutathione-dependent disulfide-bond oxidoreductase [Streptococcus dysgalactiae]KKC18229.1 S-transferase [Streptococcus dysgalactiae subsp. equisimilis]PXX83893.1 glutathione-dependent disulfide-bond oxidoreductase [Streptococcus dysgalactiae subsp. equisimilis]SQF69549.1 glutathione S-transferase [Streptococcus dysgalactiae subsp. equisimilis]SQF77681.1 glutathione S-transferase [Streptococcus dysgalactiae subsp. equisimilis]